MLVIEMIGMKDVITKIAQRSNSKVVEKINHPERIDLDEYHGLN